MKRGLLVAVAAILVAALAWRIWEKVGEKRAAAAATGGPGGSGPRGGPVPVAVGPIRTETIRDVRLFTGTLRADSEFQVAPKVAGRLEKLTVHLADPVEHGLLIAELDSEEHIGRVEQAQAELEVARANAERVRLDALLDDEELAQRVLQVQAELGIARANVEECASTLNMAEREFERAKALRGKTIMSQAALDEAEARYLAEKARTEVALARVVEKEAALRSAQVRLSETHREARATELRFAQAQVAQQEAAVKSAQVQLSYTQIHADWQGGSRVRYVGERFIDPGTMLTSNTPIVSIVDIFRLRAFIYVIERDYPLVSVGQAAAVTTDAYPHRTFPGRIARISQVLRETSRQARVEVEIANEDMALKPGMFVRLEIEFAKHDEATVIPRSALVRYHEHQGVFLVNETDRTVTFVPVRTGIINTTMAEVLDPALSGLVVTLGHHLLSDGASVVISTFSLDAIAAEE